MKQCQKCGKIKQTSEFLPNGRTADKLSKDCIACKAEAKGMSEDEYLWNYLSRVGTFRQDRSKPEYKAKELAYSAQWKKDNPEKHLAHVKAYQQRNPVLIRTRRVLKRNASILRLFTEYDWQALKEKFDRLCAYCGRSDCELTMDHVIPISRGGQHTKDNIVPACRSCNSKKHAKTPDEAGMKILARS